MIFSPRWAMEECHFQQRKQKEATPASSLFFARIGRFFISDTRQVVHTGIYGQRDPLALLKGIKPFSVLYFGIIALVNAGQQLHFNLRIPFF